MVVNQYPHLPRIFRQIWFPLAVVGLISSSIAVVDHYRRLRIFTGESDGSHPIYNVAIPDVTISVLGVALSVLLAFRTNSAYARWWEARKLWGAMVNTSRTIARQAIAFTGSSAGEFAVNAVRGQIAFVHAVRCHLRRQDVWADAGRWLEWVNPVDMAVLKSARNLPAAILNLMGRQAAAVAGKSDMTEQRFQQYDQSLTNLCDILGASERIKNTPLPRQYDYYPELFIYGYCLILPIVLVDDLRMLTPAVTILVAVAFLVLNRIGKNLEDPFENRPYDVPLTALCRTIEIDLRQSIGDTDVPDPLKPDRGVLW